MLLRLATFVCLAGFLCPLQATFTQISSPTPAYISSTTKIPITGSDFVAFASLSGTGVTINFSEFVYSGSVPGSFATWNSPPMVEESTPRVLTAFSGNTLVLSFSPALRIFGIEIQPDAFPGANISVQFYAGNTVLGEINQFVNGASGAQLFAAQSDINPFTQVRITATSSGGGATFATAQYRFAVSEVPEPGALPVLLAFAVFWTYRRQRGARS